MIPDAHLPSSGSLPAGKVLIAPDKFKGSLTAAEVAARVAAGLARGGFGGETVPLPVADGGDGTVAAAVSAGFRRVELGVRGPLGKNVTAAYALRDDTAVIEAAQACGLSLLPPGDLAPLTATSRGVGELILMARRMGAKRIVLGVGGVATTDGGAGLLQALGARLTDDSGFELPPGGGALTRLAHLDLRRLRDLSGVEFVLASDVNNPLLGPSGAAAVYGPQKGASAEDVELLEAGLRRWADVAEAAVPGAASSAAGQLTRDAPGAGAAGGLGFAALLFLGARMRPGIDMLLELASFESRLDEARLVITGEGSLDAQSLHGKAPVGVAHAAAAHDPAVPVVAVAGRCTLTEGELRAAGIARAYALTDLEPDIERCVADAGPLVERLAERIAADWLG
ncbi:MAG TPA: glycerate kinase [Trebonia sp.]|nr:glycerate kinase [Trebonia sp.]